MSLVTVRNLRVDFPGVAAVRGVSFDLDAGSCLALVGESGSGKSVTGRSLLGLTGGTVRADTLSVAGRTTLTRERGRLVASIPQEALAGLDPLRRVGAEIDTALRLHTTLDRVARARRSVELLRRVGVPDPDRVLAARPGELSGGLRQRALIAQALAGDPRVLVADEPTTALDASVRRGILDLLSSLRDDGLALLLISHDLGSVRQIADSVAVMSAGRIVEGGPVEQIFEHPASTHTRALLAARTRGVPRGTLLGGGTLLGERVDPAPVLELHDVTKRFGTVTAAEGVTLTVRAGRTLGLLGASGSGKSTIARIALGLSAPDSGTVALHGEPWVPLPERARRARRPRLGHVPQDPLGSFDPHLRAGALLAEALSAGRTRTPEGSDVTAALAAVGLDERILPARVLELSGGQRQRLAIARALAGHPEVLICDEPVSALDATVQAQVLDLLDTLQRERGLGILLISHDLDVVRHASDEVAVLDRGRIVDHGATEDVFTNPRADLTAALLAANAPDLR